MVVEQLMKNLIFPFYFKLSFIYNFFQLKKMLYINLLILKKLFLVWNVCGIFWTKTNRFGIKVD